jgi:hypothetical protein
MMELHELALLLESDGRKRSAVVCEWFARGSGTSMQADRDTTQHLSSKTTILPHSMNDPFFCRPHTQVISGSNVLAGTSFAAPAIVLSTGKVTMLAFPHHGSGIGEAQVTPEFRAYLPAPSAGSGRASKPSPESKIIDRLIAERAAAEVAPENTALADAATGDAVVLIEHAKLNVAPRVMFSDDGVLSLQWQRGDCGVLLVLCGDGMASIGFRRPGQYYAENGIEIAVTDDLPPQFTEAFAAVTT